MTQLGKQRKPSRRATILLVEDDLSMGRTVFDLLSCFGYGVVWRSTLDGARQSLTEATPDLVLLDLNLGTELGSNLTRNMHALDAPPPIVIVSAQSEDRCRQAAAQVNAVAVLRKPYQGAELLQTIGHALAGSLIH